MATKSIGATGRDYATFALHASYLDGLDTLSAAEVGEAYNDAEFSVAGTIATYTGFVASSTNTVTIQPASGQGFKNHASAASNPLKYNQSNGVGLKCTGAYSHAVVISVDHVKLKGLQILHTNASNRYCIQHITSGLTGVLVDACILEKAASTSGTVAEFRAGTFQNNLLIQRQSAGGNGLELSYPGTDVTLFNNTIVRPSDITAGGSGILAENGTTSVKNCAIGGFTTFVNDNTRFSGSNNASDVTIGFGTSNQASLTYSSQFEDVVDTGGVDFRAKSGGALIDNGTNTGAPSTDIIGQAISNTTRDIGCWELQAGGGSVGSASGSGTATATGASAAKSPGSAAGTGTATGVGKSAAVAAGSAAGVGAAAGVGKSAAVSPGAAAGVGAASAVGVSRAEGVGAASGTGSADAVGTSTAGGQGIGSASGVGAATAIGASRAEAVGAASGLSNVVGIGSSVGGAADVPMGGGGYPAPHGLMWKRKRIDQKVGDWVEQAARAYRDLTKDKPEIQKQAAKIVRPFVKPKVKYALVPKPETVDWAALRRDLEKANALLALWEQREVDVEIREEEELFMMMVA